MQIATALNDVAPSGEVTDDSGAAFLVRLRRATADSHRRLEDEVGLSPDTVDQASVRRFLEAMYGFLVPWERWAAGSGLDSEFLRLRSRLAVLERDLQHLGSDPAGLPLYRGEFGTRRIAAVHGGLYVIEGSTLGGRLVARWLADAPWLPAEGLGYFDGYGSASGAMWRAFQQRLLDVARTEGEQGIVAAANATFGCLQSWIAQRKVS